MGKIGRGVGGLTSLTSPWGGRYVQSVPGRPLVSFFYFIHNTTWIRYRQLSTADRLRCIRAGRTLHTRGCTLNTCGLYVACIRAGLTLHTRGPYVAYARAVLAYARPYVANAQDIRCIRAGCTLHTRGLYVAYARMYVAYARNVRCIRADLRCIRAAVRFIRAL